MEKSRVREVRFASGISQVELAQRAGISRQALGAIEGGVYQPSVTVALRLAHELGETVESLFGEDRRQRVAVEDVSNSCKLNSRVCLARIRDRLVAVPLPGTSVSLTPAAGVVARVLKGRRIEVSPFRSQAEMDLTLVIVGCDPGVAILRDYLARRRPSITVVAIPGSSIEALETAAHGAAHAAGIHLRDPASGQYNSPAARQCFGNKHFRMVTFAQWELGLATRRNGPVETVQDLAHPGARLINRQKGSGARAALDEAIAVAGLKPGQIEGWNRSASGHLEVAAAIASGAADAGVTIRVAAELYDLPFQPWREERYDLIVPEEDFAAPPVQQLLEALNTSMLAREIGELCAYDTRQMGTMVQA
jgi:molybdate-binding protein/DNA-binding XRE family transcriptional regulator